MKIIILYIIITFSFLSNLSSQTWDLYNIDNSSISSDTIKNLVIDSYDNIWFYSDNTINLFNQKENQWFKFDKNNSPIKGEINSIIRDHNDNIWAAGNGIYFFDRLKNNWELIDTNYNIKYIALDNSGRIYIVKDVFVYYKNNSNWIQIFDGSGPKYPSNLVIDKNNVLWFGTQGFSDGIYSYDGNELKHFNEDDYESDDFETYSVSSDSSNNIWFLTNNRLISYIYNTENLNWTKLDSNNTKLIKDRSYIYADLHIKNKVWATYSKVLGNTPRKLYNYNNNEWIDYDFNKELNFETIEQFFIYSLAIDSKNNVWIGTNKGLVKFNEAQTTVETFEQSNIKLYPNPTSEFMNIDLQDNLVISYSILDLNGKIVKQQHQNFQNQITIDTKQLIAGTYFIKLKLSDNTYVQSKFVKE